MKLFTTLALSLVLATAASADAPKGAGGEVAKTDAAKFLAFFDKLTDAVVADKDNCDKMATDVNSIIDANKDLLDMASKAKADGKKLPADAQKHMGDDVQKMGPGLQACAKNDKVNTAFKRLKI